MVIGDLGDLLEHAVFQIVEMSGSMWYTSGGARVKQLIAKKQSGRDHARVLQQSVSQQSRFPDHPRSFFPSAKRALEAAPVSNDVKRIRARAALPGPH